MLLRFKERKSLVVLILRSEEDEYLVLILRSKGNSEM